MSPAPVNRPPSICFVAHRAYGEMAGGQAGAFGGNQRQQSMMARWLAARGFPVSMLTWDEGQPDEVVLDGVRVLKMARIDDGVGGLRFLHPRWTSLVRAMRRADADIYYHNSAEYVTGQVALWCRLRGRRMIYSVASDPACDPALPVMRQWHEKALYRYGLLHADRVIVQTATQQRMLREGFGIEAVVLPMPCEGPSRGEYDPAPAGRERRRVLWVGRVVAMKRLEWLLEAAEALPALTFDVAGAAMVDTSYARDVFARAERCPNVVLRGRLTRPEMAGFYKGALALACTSEYEGFPNTFLEAWSHGVPVISTVDPDGVIAAHDLGVIIASPAELAAAIRALSGREELWSRLSANCRRWFETHHELDAVMERFEQVFLDVAARP